MGKQKRAAWFCQDCRVEMLYSEKHDYHICPKCKTTVQHPDESDRYIEDEIAVLMRELAPTHEKRDVLPPTGGGASAGGGSKSKGRSRKQDMKKKTLAQINAALAGKCAAFESG